MSKTFTILGALGALILGAAVPAFSAAPFYEGKTIRVVVGFSAGGGFDTYSRLIGRHMHKHIPGNPGIVVENMTGAASLVAANHVYKVAKPDGLTILNFHGNQVINQILGKPGIEFDARRFEYIGIPTQDNVACAFHKSSGITTFDALKGAKTPVKIGGVAPGDTTYNTARLLIAALKLPIQLVSGYKGTAEVRLAAESGEVAGGCWQWESIKSIWRQGLDSGNVFVVLQVNPKPHPELAKVANAINFAPNENSRLLLKYGGHDPAAITRPYAVAPGTPKDRVQMLRSAFAATMKDSEFLADAKKSRLDTSPLTGEEIEKIVSQLFTMDADGSNQVRLTFNEGEGVEDVIEARLPALVRASPRYYNTEAEIDRLCSAVVTALARGPLDPDEIIRAEELLARRIRAARAAARRGEIFAPPIEEQIKRMLIIEMAINVLFMFLYSFSCEPQFYTPRASFSNVLCSVRGTRFSPDVKRTFTLQSSYAPHAI